MIARILILEAGPATIAFTLYAIADGEPVATASGALEHIPDRPVLRVRRNGWEAGVTIPLTAEGPLGIGAALSIAFGAIEGLFPEARIAAVGHRIAEGGTRFTGPVALDEPTIEAIGGLAAFAPRRQEAGLAGIRAARKAYPQAVHVAVFDTAFHQGQRFEAAAYALPRDLFADGLRQTGGDGLVYEAVARELAAEWPALSTGRVIAVHAGDGISMAALDHGWSVGATGGVSPLQGLPGPTASGSIDAGALLWLMRAKGLDATAAEAYLAERSGLLGLSGVSGELGALLASDRPESREAVGHLVERMRREIGALAVRLGGLDAMVFTGSVAVHAWRLRAAVLEGLDWLGIVLDRDANAALATTISTPWSRVQVLVVPSDPAAMAARHTVAVVRQATRVMAA